MTDEKFEQIKELKDRIFQLDLIEKKMFNIFRYKPFMADIFVSIFGKTTQNRTPDEVQKAIELNEEDFNAILDGIKNQKLKLQEQFNAL